eukprot:1468490-Prymnesium_polylepis.2
MGLTPSKGVRAVRSSQHTTPKLHTSHLVPARLIASVCSSSRDTPKSATRTARSAVSRRFRLLRSRWMTRGAQLCRYAMPAARWWHAAAVPVQPRVERPSRHERGDEIDATIRNRDADTLQEVLVVQQPHHADFFEEGVEPLFVRWRRKAFHSDQILRRRAIERHSHGAFVHGSRSTLACQLVEGQVGGRHELANGSFDASAERGVFLRTWACKAVRSRAGEHGRCDRRFTDRDRGSAVIAPWRSSELVEEPRIGRVVHTIGFRRHCMLRLSCCIALRCTVDHRWCAVRIVGNVQAVRQRGLEDFIEACGEASERKTGRRISVQKCFARRKAPQLARVDGRREWCDVNWLTADRHGESGQIGIAEWSSESDDLVEDHAQRPQISGLAVWC